MLEIMATPFSLSGGCATLAALSSSSDPLLLGNFSARRPSSLLFSVWRRLRTNGDRPGEPRHDGGAACTVMGGKRLDIMMPTIFVAWPWPFAALPQSSPAHPIEGEGGEDGTPHTLIPPSKRHAATALGHQGDGAGRAFFSGTLFSGNRAAILPSAAEGHVQWRMASHSRCRSESSRSHLSRAIKAFSPHVYGDAPPPSPPPLPPPPPPNYPTAHRTRLRALVPKRAYGSAYARPCCTRACPCAPTRA